MRQSLSKRQQSKANGKSSTSVVKTGSRTAAEKRPKQVPAPLKSAKKTIASPAKAAQVAANGTAALRKAAPAPKPVKKAAPVKAARPAKKAAPKTPPKPAVKASSATRKANAPKAAPKKAAPVKNLSRKTVDARAARNKPAAPAAKAAAKPASKASARPAAPAKASGKPQKRPTPSVKAAPAKPAQVKAAPVKAAPVKTAPVKTAPVKTAPVKTAPIKAVPKPRSKSGSKLHLPMVAPAPPIQQEQPRRHLSAAAMRAFEQAIKVFNRRQFHDAKEMFENLKAKFSNDLEIVARSQMYIQVCAQKVAHTNPLPRNADELYDRGVFALNIGDFTQARHFFEKALRINPEAPHLLYSLAATHAQVGATAEALEYLQRSIQIQPRFRSQAYNDSDFSELRENKQFLELLGLTSPFDLLESKR